MSLVHIALALAVAFQVEAASLAPAMDIRRTAANNTGRFI
jgi:hypothetical protein